MTAQTLTLADFLLARIAEDEELWRLAVDKRLAFTATGTIPAIPPTGFSERKLAECEANRRIVLYSRVYAERDDPTLPGYNLARHVLWDLAFAYADHPDYDPDWRP